MQVAKLSCPYHQPRRQHQDLLPKVEPSSTSRNMLLQLATLKLLRDKLLAGVVIRATRLCNLQSNNVARQVARKCRPNDRNMPTQHIATLLVATCCVRLSTVLRHVATCWLLLAQIWPFSNLSQQLPTCCNTSQYGGQTNATCCAQQCCDMFRWHVAIVWPGLYAGSMLMQLRLTKHGKTHHRWFDKLQEICCASVCLFFYSFVARTERVWHNHEIFILNIRVK